MYKNNFLFDLIILINTFKVVVQKKGINHNDKETMPEFYGSMKKEEIKNEKNNRLVMITGSNGSIGRDVVDKLSKSGYEILGIDLHEKSLQKSFKICEPGSKQNLY